MNEKLKDKLAVSLLYKFFRLAGKGKNYGISDEEKIKRISQIKQEYGAQVKALRAERDAVIRKAVSLLEEKKIEEIRKGL